MSSRRSASGNHDRNEHHHTRSQSGRSSRHRDSNSKSSFDSPSQQTMAIDDQVIVDFHGIALSTLRKYKKAHQVRLRSGQHKEDLADAITHHFASIPPPSDEANVIEAFSQAIRNHDRSRKHRHRGSAQK